MPRHIKRGVLDTGTAPRGGGGLMHGYTTPKMGVLGTGMGQKRGILGTGMSQQRGVRHGYNPKKVRLKNWSCKKRILVTDVAQRVFLGAYLLNTLTFFWST